MLSGQLPNADNYLFITDDYLENIYQVDPATGVTGQLLPTAGSRKPISLTYDPTAKLIYWADREAHTINRYSLHTKTSTVIYRDPSNNG